jgi:hypothetical protein
MTELEYFRLLASEFASVDDATVERWLSVAGNLVNVGCLDTERAAMARALYAAHMLSLTTRSGQGGAAALGAVTSEKEGDLQRSYGGVKGGDTYMGQTSYGQQYLDITKACFGAAIMTRV